MRIELHIERLVLEGVGVDRRHSTAVHETLTTELTRLLTAPPARSWQQSRIVPRMSTLPVTSDVGDPGGLGRSIATSIYGGLTTPARNGGAR